MRGDPQVIAHLNAQLKNELTATNQYFTHYRLLKHSGFERLAKMLCDARVAQHAGGGHAPAQVGQSQMA